MVKRKAQKRFAIGESNNRNEQFENIYSLIEEFKNSGSPIVSVDTKKKEDIGNLYRDGKLFVRRGQELKRWDHDFSYLSEGKIIPHGIYDLLNNSAFINIGTSKDTSEFACDSIRCWWNLRGRYDWGTADSLLLLCDCGGSNSSRSHLFKQDLQSLADSIDLEIRVAHFPPYCSKWNYIEHRVFPHLTRTLQGVVFDSYEVFKDMTEKTKTQKGLSVKANIITKTYETKRKTSVQYFEEQPIYFDEYLSNWNYVAYPRNQW